MSKVSMVKNMGTRREEECEPLTYHVLPDGVWAVDCQIVLSSCLLKLDASHKAKVPSKSPQQL